MKSLELKIPPALLMVIFVLAISLLDDWIPGFKQNWAWHELAAKLIFALALVFIVTGVVSFRMADTTVDPTRPQQVSSIVTTGIFRFTRNPMYLGFTLILLAYVVKLSNPITAVMVVLFVLYMNQFQIKPEERALTALFGDEYRNYAAAVRRWL